MTKNQAQIKPLKAVYSYYFPETRKIVDEISTEFPHETFLQSINPGLDSFHEKAISAYLDHFKFELPDLPKFPFRYVAGGASESLFHILAYLKANQPDTPLYTLKGEYEGYEAYGTNLGLTFTSVDELHDLLSLPKGVLFLSNPSARNGNIIPNEDIIPVADYGHQIIYDVTYVGLTDPYRFDLDHPNIIAVIISMSKPFGVYYYRIGFAFSRFEIRTLEANKWFKNIHSLILAEKILKQTNSRTFVDLYRPAQKRAIEKMNREYHLHAVPSQVVLLANASSVPIGSGLEIYKRGNNYRFCLTPYYLVEERGFV